MSEEKYTSIDTNENELNLLLREVLEGCRDDLEEAKLNVAMYHDAIVDEAKSGGKERYGAFLNDALKIKGSARDRQLKLVNMFKDRVTNKEKISLVKKDDELGSMPDIAEMNRAIEEMEKAKKTNKIVIKNEHKDLFEEEDDDDNDDFFPDEEEENEEKITFSYEEEDNEEEENDDNE